MDGLSLPEVGKWFVSEFLCGREELKAHWWRGHYVLLIGWCGMAAIVGDRCSFYYTYYATTYLSWWLECRAICAHLVWYSLY